MKLMLRENVKGLGHVGEVVDVAEGYGRNFLLPRQYAVELTPANVQFIEAEKKRVAAREAGRVEMLKSLVDKIASIDITLHERVHDEDSLYGAIQAKEIADALVEEGIEVDADMVVFPEPIKKLGVHAVKIQLHHDIEAECKVWVVAKKGGDTEDGK